MRDVPPRSADKPGTYVLTAAAPHLNHAKHLEKDEKCEVCHLALPARGQAGEAGAADEDLPRLPQPRQQQFANGAVLRLPPWT